MMQSCLGQMPLLQKQIKKKIKYNLRYLFILLEIAKENHIFQQNQMSKVSSEFMNSQDTVN